MNSCKSIFLGFFCGKTAKKPTVIFRTILPDGSQYVMILLIHHSFTRILPFKDVNLKTSRLPLSPLQAQKQIYFLNQANEKKHLNFELHFSFFILISVPVHFSLHTSFPQYAQIQHTSHIYIFFKELGIYIGRELFIHSFQL